MEWPKTFNELTGIKNPTIRIYIRLLIRLLGASTFTVTSFLVARVGLIFVALTDGSLSIKGLASNNPFNFRNLSQNDVDSLSKISDAFFV